MKLIQFDWRARGGLNPHLIPVSGISRLQVDDNFKSSTLHKSVENMEKEYLQRRIEVLESEIQLLKRRVTAPTPTKEDIALRIQEYRSLVESTSKALHVTEDPDTLIARLRAKEY